MSAELESNHAETATDIKRDCEVVFDLGVAFKGDRPLATVANRGGEV